MSYISKMTYKASYLGQSDRLFGLRSEFVSRWVHAGSYEFLTVAVLICATLVNTKTHRETAFDQLYY